MQVKVQKANTLRLVKFHISNRKMIIKTIKNKKQTIPSTVKRFNEVILNKTRINSPMLTNI